MPLIDPYCPLIQVNNKSDPPICRLKDLAAMEAENELRRSKTEKKARVQQSQSKKIR